MVSDLLRYRVMIAVTVVQPQNRRAVRCVYRGSCWRKSTPTNLTAKHWTAMRARHSQTSQGSAGLSRAEPLAGSRLEPDVGRRPVRHPLDRGQDDMDRGVANQQASAPAPFICPVDDQHVRLLIAEPGRDDLVAARQKHAREHLLGFCQCPREL